MKRLCFNDYEDFSYNIDENYTALKTIDDLSDISVIGFYKDIKEILKQLIILDYEILNVDLKECEIDGYDREFILSIDSTGGIWVEKIWNSGKYLNYGSTVTYIFDDCNSKVVNAAFGGHLIEVGFDENVSGSIEDEDSEDCEIEIEFECDCDECNNCCKNNDLEYKVLEPLTTEEARELIKELDVRIQKIHEVFDEMKLFDKLFRW